MTLPPFAWPAMLAAALGATAAAELYTPLQSPELPPIMFAPAAAQAADLNEAMTSWSATVLRRPLFRPDRQPVASDGAATAALPRLSAIVITASSSAAIFSGGNGKGFAVAPGGMINGYRVTTIGPGTVTITGPGGSRTLHPQFAPGANPEAPVPPLTPLQRTLDNH